MSGITDGKAEEILDTALVAKELLDMSIEEYELARRYPLEYDLRVNGIRHIVVRDLDQEFRYTYQDGRVTQLKEVF